MARVSVSVSFKGVLVDDEGGNFYYKETPQIRYGAVRLDEKERNQIIAEVTKELAKKLKGMK